LTHSRHRCIATSQGCCQSITSSARAQHRRDFQAEHLGSFEVDNQLELGRLRKISIKFYTNYTCT
jgi:hypothetical protein